MIILAKSSFIIINGTLFVNRVFGHPSLIRLGQGSNLGHAALSCYATTNARGSPI